MKGTKAKFNGKVLYTLPWRGCTISGNYLKVTDIDKFVTTFDDWCEIEKSARYKTSFYDELRKSVSKEEFEPLADILEIRHWVRQCKLTLDRDALHILHKHILKSIFIPQIMKKKFIRPLIYADLLSYFICHSIGLSTNQLIYCIKEIIASFQLQFKMFISNKIHLLNIVQQHYFDAYGSAVPILINCQILVSECTMVSKFNPNGYILRGKKCTHENSLVETSDGRLWLKRFSIFELECLCKYHQTYSMYHFSQPIRVIALILNVFEGNRLNHGIDDKTMEFLLRRLTVFSIKYAKHYSLENTRLYNPSKESLMRLR